MTSWPDPKSIEQVPYKDREVVVKVVSVHDGDTFKVLMRFGSDYLKLGIRLVGVDAPEVQVRGRDDLAKLEERAGQRVRERLAELIADQELIICPKRWDKYGGRLLCEAFLPGQRETISSFLVSKGLVKAYDGGQKSTWTADELEHILAT